jgi:O-Antigen ligase
MDTPFYYGERGPRWRGRALRSLNPSLGLIPLTALVGALVGAAVFVSPVLAAALTGVLVFLAVAARYDLIGIAVVLTAVLPWLVVTAGALPRLTETLGAAATVGATILVASPRSDGSAASSWLRIGLFCFFGTVVIGQHFASDQLIEASKYLVLPAMVFAVTEATNHDVLKSLRKVALWSGTAAVGTNLALGLLGVARGTRSSGEILGYSGEHDLALLAGCIAAAGIVAVSSLRAATPVAIGAAATIATGVRSVLPGLALLVVSRLISSGARLRTIVLVGLSVVAVFASGATHVLEARFHYAERQGEFRSLNSLGSGRGEVYGTAVHSWASASPIHWFVGTGLRSIPKVEQEKLGAPLVGHSDLVQVGVELGLIGLLGFLLIWAVLIARARSKAPLLVLGAFSLFNGALEYGAPAVVALLLTVWNPSGDSGEQDAFTPELSEQPSHAAAIRAGHRA